MPLLLLCLIINLAMASSYKDPDDIISEAFEKTYYDAKDEHFPCSDDSAPMPKTGNMFIFLQKQNSDEDVIAREGIKYIMVMENLVNITGKSLYELMNDKKYQTAFYKQACEKITPSCTKYIDSKYRSANGICNNLHHPKWGSTLQAHARYLPPAYADDISEPRKFGVNGKMLPSPRKISNTVLAGNGGTPLDDKMTLLTFAFGQFLDHDLTFTPVLIDKHGRPLKCCGKDKKEDGCFPIDIPEHDPRFGNRGCMDFSRSIPAHFRDGCKIGYREQVNRLTSFIDGGMIYGDSKHVHEVLDGPNGALRTSEGNLLPAGGLCNLRFKEDYCPLAGDERTNEFASLGGMHVIFMRYHNIIAKQLRKNTYWSSQQIFLETRKIVGAIIQQIVYGEYLPRILSSKTRQKYSLNLQKFGYLDEYDKTINPTVKNIFATAAFRFGHSQIPEEIGYLTHEFVMKTFKTNDVLMDPHIVVTEKGANLQDLVRFLLHKSAFKVDRQVEDAVRNELFRDAKGMTFDLVSFNIQRGRDHGLQPYNRWRKWCGLHVATSFSDLIDHDPDTQNKLKDTYDHVDDIDAFVGGIAEIQRGDGAVGPLFDCLLGRQFHETKFGDRYWYENSGPGGFTPDQLYEIRKMKISKIICETMKLPKIQRHAFAHESAENPLENCADLPDIDLSYWNVC